MAYGPPTTVSPAARVRLASVAPTSVPSTATGVALFHVVTDVFTTPLKLTVMPLSDGSSVPYIFVWLLIVPERGRCDRQNRTVQNPSNGAAVITCRCTRQRIQGAPGNGVWTATTVSPSSTCQARQRNAYVCAVRRLLGVALFHVVTDGIHHAA